jgi:hypothetical protein
MTKYERIAAHRVRVIRGSGGKWCVYIPGLTHWAVCGADMERSTAIKLCDDIRAALIADMCKVANVKPPKARKR